MRIVQSEGFYTKANDTKSLIIDLIESRNEYSLSRNLP